MDKDYLLKKWLNDDLSDAESIDFQKLDDFHFNQKIIDAASNFKASHTFKVDSFETLESKLINKTPIRRLNWNQTLLRIASVFIISFGIYYFFSLNSLTKVNTLASQKANIELPDNSIVTLNALSSLSYSKSNWEKNREVKLNGEAFFKVAKGEVFDVLTDDGIVTVLGTQFNVKQRKNYFEVKCYDGVVKVNTNDTIKNLLGGDTFRIQDGILSFSATTYKEPQWIVDLSTFKSVPFSEVIEEFERQYSIEIQYNGKRLNQLFSGGFAHDNLENALKSISVPLQLTYQIDSSSQVYLFDVEK